MDCGDPSSNLTLLNKQYQSGTGVAVNVFPNSVTLICLKGFIFNDLSDSNVMTCTNKGDWSFVTNCIRKLILNNFLLDLNFLSFLLILNNIPFCTNTKIRFEINSKFEIK